MLPGRCGKCGASRSRYLEADRKHSIVATVCFLCGHIPYYRNPNGTLTHVHVATADDEPHYPWFNGPNGVALPL